MRTLVVGRSPFADVVLADGSVAAHHAELVVTDDGRLHLTDCAGGTGSFRRGDDGSWTAIRQAFVGMHETLRLGDHTCTVRDLLKGAREPLPGAAGETRRGEAGEGGGSTRMRPRGRVERDPRTGEIVHRRP